MFSRLKLREGFGTCFHQMQLKWRLTLYGSGLYTPIASIFYQPMYEQFISYYTLGLEWFSSLVLLSLANTKYE